MHAASNSSLPLELKYTVSSYLDASSFVSLCCTSTAWNRLLRHQDSMTWSRHVQEHFNTRLQELWKRVLASSRLLRVSVHRYGMVLARDWGARDAVLYKNAGAWVRLQERRRAEMDAIVLLDEDLWYPAYSVKAHRRRMAVVSAFSIRKLAASLARLDELDAAIAEIDIGWSWSRVDNDTERAVRAVHSEAPVLYLKSCAARTTECCRLNDAALRAARDSLDASLLRVDNVSRGDDDDDDNDASTTRKEIRRLVVAEKDASASHMEFLELRRVLLEKVKEVCARELVDISACKKRRRAS